MKYLMLKLSDKEVGIPFNDPDALLKRAEGKWKITLKTLGDAERALLLFRGQVLGEYSIGDKFIFDRDSGRVTLDLTPINDSKLINRVLDYPTANPASLLDVTKIKYKK